MGNIVSFFMRNLAARAQTLTTPSLLPETMPQAAMALHRRCSKGRVPGDSYRPGCDQLSRLRHGLFAEQKTRGANCARAPAH